MNKLIKSAKELIQACNNHLYEWNKHEIDKAVKKLEDELK